MVIGDESVVKFIYLGFYFSPLAFILLSLLFNVFEIIFPYFKRLKDHYRSFRFAYDHIFKNKKLFFRVSFYE